MSTNDTALMGDFLAAQNQLASSILLSNEERYLASHVSLRIADKDSMYAGSPYHYLLVGLSALRVIDDAFRSAGRHSTNGPILDFACGFGRVLRFLRAKYINAAITAAEIDEHALSFCCQEFSADPFLSKENFAGMKFPHLFDLVRIPFYAH